MSRGTATPPEIWSDPWPVHRIAGTAEDLHHRELPAARGIWLCEPTEPTLVLGSTQPDDTVDVVVARDRGLAVARRRSGGGLVFVDPRSSIWVDLTIARSDPLWTDDVGTSMLWLGEVFVVALRRWMQGRVHTGRFLPGPHGHVVCFAGLSPGEVLGMDEVGAPKVVGISQRRGRDGARFQCVLYRHWLPEAWAGALTDPRASEATTALRVGCVSTGPDEVVAALVEALRRGSDVGIAAREP